MDVGPLTFLPEANLRSNNFCKDELSVLPVIFLGFERILTFLSDCFDETGSNISTMPTEQG